MQPAWRLVNDDVCGLHLEIVNECHEILTVTSILPRLKAEYSAAQECVDFQALPRSLRNLIDRTCPGTINRYREKPFRNTFTHRRQKRAFG